MPEPRGHTLLTETLRVLNQVFERHGDRSPCREILARLGRFPGGIDVGIEVHEGDPRAPVDTYLVRFRDGRLRVIPQARGEQRDAPSWRVSVDYLRDVTEDPDTYLAHPEKLDLGWLEERLALD